MKPLGFKVVVSKPAPRWPLNAISQRRLTLGMNRCCDLYTTYSLSSLRSLLAIPTSFILSPSQALHSFTLFLSLAL